MNRELWSLATAQQFKVADRDGLGLGHPQQVNPAREDVLDPDGFQSFLFLGSPFRIGESFGEVTFVNLVHVTFMLFSGF